MAELIDALKATSATLAFDAIGGGKLAGQILTGMEAAATARERVQPVRVDPTSRSTSTGASTGGRPSSAAASAWRGASAGGC